MEGDGVDSYLADVDASYSAPTTGSGSSGNSDSNGFATLLGTLGQAATTGAKVYGQLNPGNHPLAANTAARNQAAGGALTKYLPWAIGAAVLLVVLAMFTGGRR